VVASEARKRGIGKQLCEACEPYARDWGAGEIFLLVEEGNMAGRGLYEKCGYAGPVWVDEGASAMRLNPKNGELKRITSATLALVKVL